LHQIDQLAQPMVEGMPENLGNSHREGLSMKLCTKSGRTSIGASAAVGFLAFSTALAWNFTKPPSIDTPFDFDVNYIGLRTHV
jgi:hypothetical protein